ncbi:hypothetical protein PYH37_004114 [Sinorhizobium numidicum]|uniref:Uncharacterized protein n=1 Tax=Sinorhizobium numidicum TaxID=680248 RepID=A0ABY8CWJ7_9HYPH|nr:hypothetical protein [Sinorhizobium numidicum]WEX75863.1 hypothetical protein PYH37_004114 [Sinorhizobium numidicum]WEX82522.1 hypothetical protein PYH38_004826 [Sinorhizobium numidicum]
MTQVVTISATTAACAMEAVKPSARVRGDGPADEAITLLSIRRQDGSAAAASAPKIKSALPLGLMLISAEDRPPQETETEALRRYREHLQDEESGEQRDSRQEETAGDRDEDADEIVAMLDQFIQRA